MLKLIFSVILMVTCQSEEIYQDVTTTITITDTEIAIGNNRYPVTKEGIKDMHTIYTGKNGVWFKVSSKEVVKYVDCKTEIYYNE